jgi:crotonobetainyl-CoA:carnitine CoA-transferase CaiB-like acyl-CoA transferase
MELEMTALEIRDSDAPEADASNLLEGVIVADFTRFLGGPFATQLLADLGATIVKVEGYPVGDFVRHMTLPDSFPILNRNKRSIHVDFSHPDGLEVVRRLIARSDACVELSNPGSMAKFQLDYESLLPYNPSLVYCSLSAFGQTGPYSGTPGHAFNMEGLTGNIEIIETDDGRPAVKFVGYDAPASSMAGYAAAMAIVAGVLRRRLSGKGCYIDAGIWDCGIAGHCVPNSLAILGRPLVHGFAGPATPKYAPYETADHHYLMVCAMEHKYWTRFCEAFGFPELIDMYEDSHDDDYGERHPELYDVIAARIAERTIAEWEEVCMQLDAPVTPIYSRLEALTSRQARERNIVVHGDTSAGMPEFYVGSPLVIDGQRGRRTDFAPALGAHTRDILSWLNLSDADIDALLADDVVRTWNATSSRSST